ncbi:hypothetical protein CROQUDRAFT_99550 [Cronartium quercuum f. sp. fusiforme G11]|uniref:Secreted protein n=1 Tax=Cronartium quercuum f. sp. fusiforme G11 TaxID=708437 RepID=A0A9P6N8A0_9BASI|nr:hypothetical protein CROQUDRAFT_99550 [Cronartium quercuum f. sp. fusiforme G11]
MKYLLTTLILAFALVSVSAQGSMFDSMSGTDFYNCSSWHYEPPKKGDSSVSGQCGATHCTNCDNGVKSENISDHVYGIGKHCHLNDQDASTDEAARTNGSSKKVMCYSYYPALDSKEFGKFDLLTR